MFQCILLRIFGLAAFLYVDDAFWAATDVVLPNGLTQADWFGNIFRDVVTGLLGWELDTLKRGVGASLQL